MKCLADIHESTFVYMVEVNRDCLAEKRLKPNASLRKNVEKKGLLMYEKLESIKLKTILSSSSVGGSSVASAG